MPFQKGDDPNRNMEGRPKGSLSVMGKLKQMWEENPEDFINFVNEYRKDPMSRRHITEMLDGKPRQPIDHDVKGELTINILEYAKGNNNSV